MQQSDDRTVGQVGSFGGVAADEFWKKLVAAEGRFPQGRTDETFKDFVVARDRVPFDRPPPEHRDERVIEIDAAIDVGVDDRHRLVRRQPCGGRRELLADRDIGFLFGHAVKMVSELFGKNATSFGGSIAEEANGPAADRRVGAIEQR